MSAASSLTPENTLLRRGCVLGAPGCTSLLLSVSWRWFCRSAARSGGAGYVQSRRRRRESSSMLRIRNFTYIASESASLAKGLSLVRRLEELSVVPSSADGTMSADDERGRFDVTRNRKKRKKLGLPCFFSVQFAIYSQHECFENR